MKLLGITYKGPELDDIGTYRSLPEAFRKFIDQVNGIVAFKGGLHIRGCCKLPEWHSIDTFWTGKLAFWKTYPEILDIDIPFAEDCLGDQFLFRSNKIIKLNTENGEIEELQLDFINFLEEIEKDPVQFLGLHPLIQFEMEGKIVEPGHLLSAYPPFCINQTGEVSLTAMPSLERISSLAQLYKQIRGLKDGEAQFIVE